ncbi:hypothetical protein Q5752_001545 [Cryptotrichosporon argae]
MPTTFADLPREVIRNIVNQLYDPLELTQQDRLTWGIFSTVDMHQEREDCLLSLVAFGSTCRRVRREVRATIFRCIRISSTAHAHEVVRNRGGWARYVRSMIVDLTMFDDARRPRSCWQESALLTALLTAVPNLSHLSFFADASDDSTLALLFAALIPHPSLHAVPPPAGPPSPSAVSAVSTSASASGSGAARLPAAPFAARLRSFGWRQRAAPPAALAEFASTSTFVSALHVLRHAYALSLLVLDADMDEMRQADVLEPLRELALRTAPLGERPSLISLMLCGPIRGWDGQFLRSVVDTLQDIKELFIDRPLGKQRASTTVESFIDLLLPLADLPQLRLLQIGSYMFPPATQFAIATRLAGLMPSLIVVGLLGEEGDTTWWGLWRGVRGDLGNGAGHGWRQAAHGAFAASGPGITVQPLGDGHLAQLGARLEAQQRSVAPTPPWEASPSARELAEAGEGDAEME